MSLLYDEDQRQDEHTSGEPEGFYKRHSQKKGTELSDDEVNRRFGDITSQPELSDLKEKGFMSDKKGPDGSGFYKSDAEGSERKLLNKNSKAGKVAGKAKNSGRQRAALVIIGSIGLPTIAIFIVLYGFLGFSVEHLARLQTAYRFGHVQRAIGKVTRQILVADMGLTENSLTPRNLPGGRVSLASRMAGWTPEKAMRTLGASDILLTYDRGALPGSRKLTSFTDTRTGTVFNASELGEGRMLNELEDLIDVRFAESSKGWLFRRKSVNYMRSASNVRLSRYKQFIDARARGQDISIEEGRRYRVSEDNSLVRRDVDIRNPDARAAIAEVDEALDDGRVVRPQNILSPSHITTLNAIGTISEASFMMTMYCIYRDVLTNVDAAIKTRIDGFLNHASTLFTSSDMNRAGDATQAALRAEDEKWQGATKSQEYAMATNRPYNTVATEDTLPGANYPMKVLGLSLSSWQTILTFGNAANKAVETALLGPFAPLSAIPGVPNPIDYVCRFLFEPVVQFGIAAADIGAMVLSLGSSKVATKLSAETVKQALKGFLGEALVGAMMNFFLLKSVEMATGLDFTFGQGEGAQAYNTAGAGNVISSSQIASQYTDKISPQELALQQRQSIRDFQDSERSKGVLYAYFSPHSPFSLTSSFAMSAPKTLVSLASSFGSFMEWLFKPANSLGFAIAGVGADSTYDPNDEFYGMENDLYGFSADDFYDPVALINTLESNDGALLEQLIGNYGVCLTYTATDRALGNVDGKCEDEGAKQLKSYYMYCETIDQVARVGSDNDGYSTRDCLDLAGADQNKIKLTSGTSATTTGPASTTIAAPGLNGYAVPCQGEPRNMPKASYVSVDWNGIPDSGTIGTNSAGEPMKVYIREACEPQNARTILIVGSIHGSENGGQRVGFDLLYNTNLPEDMRDVRIVVVPEYCSCAGTGTRGNTNGVDLNRNNDFNWAGLPQTQTFDSGFTYSKGSAPASEPETQALNAFLLSLGEVDLALFYHDNLNYVTAVGSTPTSINAAYGRVTGMPIVGGKQNTSTVTQSGSIDAWYNSKTGANTLLVELPADNLQTDAYLQTHVQAVLTALEVAR